MWDLCSAEHQQIVFNTWDINLQEHLFESSHIKLLCISWWHLVCSFHLGNSRTPSRHRELSPSALRRPEQSCISKPNIIIHLTVYYLHMSNTAGEHHNSTVCVISYCTVAISCCNPEEKPHDDFSKVRLKLLKQNKVPLNLATSYLSYNFLTDGSTNQLLSAVYSTVSRLTC